MTSQLAARHPANGVDEVATVEIFKTVLIRIVCIGVTVELMSRGILDPVLVTSVLWDHQNMWNIEYEGVSVPLATLVQTSLGLYQSPTGPGR